MNSIKNNKPFSYPPLSPVASIEASIADGLGDVVGLDVRGVVEVGDGAGDFQDAAIGAGGELGEWS